MVLAGLRGFMPDYCNPGDRRRRSADGSNVVRRFGTNAGREEEAWGMKFESVRRSRDGTGSFPARSSLSFLLALLAASVGWSQATPVPAIVPGSMNMRWNPGAADCARNPQAPLEVHAYEARTFILRENLCATFEAPFLYLLIGVKRALLIDTGDVADAKKMPLAETVVRMLPGDSTQRLPLLVVHTHRHLDHRAGDPQFAPLANVEVVGFDLASVQRYFDFNDWPNGRAVIDLGDRAVDVIPTPGHNQTELTFYDRNTGLLFTGDFLMPARLLIDDAKADLASAERLAAFIQDRPVSYVLGGHVEMNSEGQMYDWESQYHPHEHVLQLPKDDVLALPRRIASFNGFYSKQGQFVMMNSMRLLLIFGVGSALALACLILFAVRYFQRRKSRQWLTHG
jgi:hydroxyacylglutathione hydrolase